MSDHLKVIKTRNVEGKSKVIHVSEDKLGKTGTIASKKQPQVQQTTPTTMSKLYVGNLPSECNEPGLRQLFQDHNLSCTTILVKRGGYAFVDCNDQSTADRAIDKLNENF
ncbi:hypothetical protein KQX54_015780 [Cotesia glomerata]|uniref:RRM domain-containing protein n=1 Tax=Cotesia glomerata TaxID=32391 RepID=A0AAV7IFL8_COTGL|nr:hypothetical protein KQX54_015780 [Cotesia glomerata]